MTRERSATTSVLVTFFVVLATAGGGFVAVTGGVAAEHDSPGNYTVYLPEQSDHQTGDTNGASASIWHLASMSGGFEDTPSPKGFEKASFLTIGSDEIDFSACGTSNTAAFGLDRGDDDPGSKTNEDLLAHREDSQFNSNGIIVDFFEADDLAGSPVSINADDQIVAVQNDCYKMPSEPGWYQIFGTLNGTGYDGSEFEIELESHYFYICDCSSEQEAREKLGPPPSEASSGSGSGSQSSEPTATATPEPAATATPEPEAAATATATPAQAQSTPTATPASSSGGGGGATDQTTPTPEPQQQQSQQQQQQSQPQATATAAGNGAVPVTPTVAEGPGFGAGLALVALAGAALLARRRSQ